MALREIAELFVGVRVDSGEVRKDIKDVEKRFQKLGKNMKAVGRDLTKYVTLPMVAVGAGALKAASDWETAMTGVAKTVDAPASEIARLGREFQALSEEMPTSANELARIGEAAGQLGIETENIVGFVKVMADLGVTTNLSSEEAATALARLANITQMPQTEFDRLGSVVVELGNNLATTEREIVEMGLRLAGAGKQVGISEAQILGLAGALSSVGIEAQAGGTAFSRVMLDIQKAAKSGGDKLEKFAAIAGVSAEEFKTRFETDAAGAIVMFVKGLQNIQESGGNVAGVLDTVGFGQMRVRDALLRSAGAGDLMADAIDQGSAAWEENTALTDEASMFYETMANRLKTVRNQLVNTAADFGQQLKPVMDAMIDDVLPVMLNMLDKLVTVFSKLPVGVQATIGGLSGIVALSGPVLAFFGMFIEKVWLLKKAVDAYTASQLAANKAKWGFIGAIGKLAAPLALLAGAYATVRAEQNRIASGAKPVVTGFQGIGQSAGGVAGSVAAASEQLARARGEMEKTAVASSRLVGIIRGTPDDVDPAERAMEEYSAAIQSMGGASEAAKDEAVEFLKQLREQEQQLGLTARELMEFELRSKGATDAQIRQALSIQTVIDGYDKVAKKIADARKAEEAATQLGEERIEQLRKLSEQISMTSDAERRRAEMLEGVVDPAQRASIDLMLEGIRVAEGSQETIKRLGDEIVETWEKSNASAKDARAALVTATTEMGRAIGNFVEEVFSPKVGKIISATTDLIAAFGRLSSAIAVSMETASETTDNEAQESIANLAAWASQLSAFVAAIVTGFNLLQKLFPGDPEKLSKPQMNRLRIMESEGAISPEIMRLIQDKDLRQAAGWTMDSLVNQLWEAFQAGPISLQKFQDRVADDLNRVLEDSVPDGFNPFGEMFGNMGRSTPAGMSALSPSSVATSPGTSGFGRGGEITVINKIGEEELGRVIVDPVTREIRRLTGAKF